MNNIETYLLDAGKEEIKDDPHSHMEGTRSVVSPLLSQGSIALPLMAQPLPHLRGLGWRPASAKGLTPGSWLANQMAPSRQ